MQSNKQGQRHTLGKQSGSTLVISLIILIVLMLLGVTAMNTSDTQYKLSGNLQFENMALNNAETAENVAEHWLEVNANGTSAWGSGTALSTINPLTMHWDNTDLVPPTNVTQKQDYVIGYVATFLTPGSNLGDICPDPTNQHNFECVNTYQITARGQGGRGATKFVQTYYAVQLK